MKHVLVTGGAGYVGGVLIPRLIDKGYRVTVYDTCWYGRDHLPRHPRLEVVEGDIRDTLKLAMALAGVHTVLHLACVSNDPSFDLDPNLSRSINFDCFETIVIAAKQAGVRRFVYCSSSSVYGVSEQPNVTEEHPLIPVSHYNLYKGLRAGPAPLHVPQLRDGHHPAGDGVWLQSPPAPGPVGQHPDQPRGQ